MILEACIENITCLKEVVNAGANRIELCDNLAVGGTTVSLGVRDYAKYFCDSNNVELAVMIRVRGGNFVYNNIEKAVMYNDLKEMSRQGIKRAVIGALTEDGDIDKDFIKELVSAPKFFRKEMNFTFHMAFDHIGVGLEPKEALEKRIEAIKTLSKLGIDTILTHGSHESNDIFENIETLKAYIECGIKNHVDIMPGGGVNFENLDKLIKKLPNMVAAHGTKIVEI
jgi:putative copper homeostasis protein cutC